MSIAIERCKDFCAWLKNQHQLVQVYREYGQVDRAEDKKREIELMCEYILKAVEER